MGGKKENKGPLTQLQKRAQKYSKRKVPNMGKREKDTLRKLRKFSKSLHNVAKTFNKKAPEKLKESEENEESENDSHWFRDLLLHCNKLPSNLNNYKFDDYVVHDDKK